MAIGVVAILVGNARVMLRFVFRYIGLLLLRLRPCMTAIRSIYRMVTMCRARARARNHWMTSLRRLFRHSTRSSSVLVVKLVVPKNGTTQILPLPFRALVFLIFSPIGPAYIGLSRVFEEAAACTVSTTLSVLRFNFFRWAVTVHSVLRLC